MKKVLLHTDHWGNGHAFDVSTSELEAAAFLTLFQLFDEWKYYEHLEDEMRDLSLYTEDERNDTLREHKLVMEAREGFAEAAESLLISRVEAESEFWQIVYITDTDNTWVRKE